MKRRVVLATVLCLAVAALGIGAAPALAADGCDCHTADPPTATAAHAPFVAGITDCAVCHVGMTAPHTGPLTKPIFTLDGRSVAAGYRLHGKIIDYPALGVGVVHPDVTVYLQQRLWGATEFTDVGQSITNKYGNFGFTVASPVPYAYYRAIDQGWIGPTWTSLPSMRILKPTPDVLLKVRGFTQGRPLTPTTVKLGRTLTVSGAVAPADLGGKVTIRVLKRVGHKWATRLTAKRAISTAGTYRWKFTPRSRGEYRVHARVPATAAHRSGVARFPPGGLTISVY